MKMHHFEMYPEEAFQPCAGKGMRLYGKGGGGAPGPDPNIGLAQKQLADLATEQWNTFKTEIYPEMRRQTQVQEARAGEQWEVTKEISQEQRAMAKEAYKRYEAGAIPAMEKLKADADLYSAPKEQERLAGLSMGDIKTAADVARQQTEMRQRAYGIDPTSGVAASNANANQIMLAGAQAAAANQTRQAAKDLGLQKQASVYNMYAGLPAQAAGNTQLGLAAGAQGFNVNQSALGNYGGISSAMSGAGNAASNQWGQVGQLGVGSSNAAMQAYVADQQRAAAATQGMGSAIGLGLGAYAALAASDIRLKEDIVRVGTLPNGVGIYEYAYKPEYKDRWGHGRFRGVMAHELEPHIPEAVITHADGYKMVNYALLA